MKRNVLVAVVVVLFGFSAVWLAAVRSAPASAQEGEVPWTSSAELPSDQAPENSPPPDFGPEDELGGGLVSWRVVGSALKPRENNVSYSVDSNGGCAYVTAGSNFTVWNTPIHLPNGSVIDTLRMYFNDTSGFDSTGWFTVYDLYGTIEDEWNVSSTGSLGSSFTDSGPINHTIDYSVYSYVINWRPNVTGSTMQLCGFRVFYTPPPFGLGFIPAVLTP